MNRIKAARFIPAFAFLAYATMLWGFGYYALEGIAIFSLVTYATLGGILAFFVFAFLTLANVAPIDLNLDEGEEARLWLQQHSGRLLSILGWGILALLPPVGLFFVANPPPYQFIAVVIFSDSLLFATAVLFEYYLLRIFGQDYDSISGVSMTGARSFAWLAKKRFELGESDGVNYLRLSAHVANQALNRRDIQLDTLVETEVILDYLDQKDFGKYRTSLLSAADGLAGLPSFVGLEQHLTPLRVQLGISGRYKVKSSAEGRHYLLPLVALMSAAAAILGVLPESARTSLLSFLSTQTSQTIIVLLDLVGMALAYQILTYSLRYEVLPWKIPKGQPQAKMPDAPSDPV